jgi:hypothetical protein
VTSSDNCGKDTTDVVKIEVRDKLDAGALITNQTICYNTVPPQLSNSAATGGATPYTYLWQENTANVVTGWTTASGSVNSETYTPPALTSTKYYRRIVTSSDNCGKDTTDVVKIEVHDKLDAGTLIADIAICYNISPGELSYTAASGGVNLTYQWYESIDNTTWTSISGATNATYTPLALTATRYYKRTVTSGSGCGSLTTTVLTITVHGNLTAGTLIDDKSICYNTAPGELSSVAASGGTNLQYQWEESADNSTWSDIVGETNATYSPPALTATRYYRRKVTSDGSCGSATTPVLTITVYGNLKAGTIAAPQTICHGKVPNKLIELTPATGGDGVYDYSWEYSIDNGLTWTDGGSSDPAEYVSGALTQTTLFRRTVKDHTCNTSVAVVSAPVTITVRHPSLYNYPDLRIRVCPDGKPVNLSKYVDTLDLNGTPIWSGVGIGTNGIIPANALGSQGTYTFTYTVSNPCTTGDITRKVYAEVLKLGRMRPLRDTIVICADNADAININQIFGIDAGKGTWTYKSHNDHDIDAYVTESHSTTYGGAVVLNGKTLYGSPDAVIAPITYNGIKAKKAVFTYTSATDSCLGGKSYSIVVVLTGN